MNAAVGEKEIKVSGRTLLLRPCFEALVEIEARTKPLNELLADFIKKRVKQTEVVVVIYACAKAGAEQEGSRPLSFEQVGDLCWRHGIMKLGGDALECVVHVMTAGRTEEEKKTAELKEEKTDESTGTPSTASP